MQYNTPKKHVGNHKPEVPSKRVCHDCGKPTTDYRCPKCLKKWREANHISENQLYFSSETIYC